MNQRLNWHPASCVAAMTLFAFYGSVGDARTPPHSASAPIVEEDDGVFISGLAAWNQVSRRVFGHELQEGLLRLQEPIEPEAGSTSWGLAGADEPFDVQTGFMVRLDISQFHDQLPPGLVAWSWCGAIFGPQGAIPCGGVYFSSPSFNRLMIVGAWNDENRAWQAFSTAVGGYGPRYDECRWLILHDPRASTEERLAQNDANACDASRWNDFWTIGAITCIGVGGLACVVTAGWGCLAIPVCLVAAGGVALNFSDKMDIECQRVDTCLCITAQSRRDNPGTLTPVCAFTCPALLPLK